MIRSPEDSFILRNRVKMPCVGYGTYLEEGEEAYQAELKRQADLKAAEEKRLSNPEEAKKDAAVKQEFNALRKAHGKKEI